MQLAKFFLCILSSTCFGYTRPSSGALDMLICSIWFSAPSFWMGGGLESRCVGRVYGVDGASNFRHDIDEICALPGHYAA